MPGIQRFGAGHLYHSLWERFQLAPWKKRAQSSTCWSFYPLSLSMYQGQLLARGSPIFCPTYAPPLSSFPFAPLAVGSTG